MSLNQIAKTAIFLNLSGIFLSLLVMIKNKRIDYIYLVNIVIAFIMILLAVNILRQ